MNAAPPDTAALRADRERLADEIRPHYDVVICGGGTAGCVIARRLSDHPDLSVLLIEAGGSDRVPAVLDTTLWMSNIGSERDWGYSAEPAAGLAGRAARLPMGKVLGGGSSINGSIWARGHRHDWDGWAAATGDPGWGLRRGARPVPRDRGLARPARSAAPRARRPAQRAAAARSRSRWWVR